MWEACVGFRLNDVVETLRLSRVSNHEGAVIDAAALVIGAALMCCHLRQSTETTRGLVLLPRGDARSLMDA